jgi:hypothetical protein
MAITYSPIATTTLSTSATTVDFTSISGSYTDLILICSLKGTDATDLALRFNSDSGSNYSATQLYGAGTAAGSTRTTSQTYVNADYYGYIQSTNFTVNIIHIMNYSNTNTYKTVLARASQAGNGTNAGSALWRSTSAITSIRAMLTNAESFASGSTFTLYGIKAA